MARLSDFADRGYIGVQIETVGGTDEDRMAVHSALLDFLEEHYGYQGSWLHCYSTTLGHLPKAD